MVPRPLGRTGLSIAPVGLGTVKLGRNTDVRYPLPFALPSDAEVRELIETAFALGVTLYDTAPAYGESERRLAPFVAAHRDRIVLCTKCGESYAPGRSTYDFSADALTRSAEESLRRLGTDRVDLLLLHSDGRDVEILTRTDAVPALRKLKTEGKARAIGISAKTPEGIREACRSLDVVMASYSKADPSLEAPLREAHDAGLGVLAIKALGSGRLGDHAGDALAFVLEKPFLDAAVLGTLSPAHLREAVETADRVAGSRDQALGVRS